jgi:hypothetical protein
MSKYDNPNTYIDGYWGKIDYWQSKVAKAVKESDIHSIKYASNKLAYFVQRQEEVYG